MSIFRFIHYFSHIVKSIIVRREDMSKHDGWVLKRFEEKEPLIRKMFATSRGSDGESIGM